MDAQTLAVNLPASIVYVSGSVNGVAYIWTNTGENRWEAVVARSPNETYVVVLNLINDLGTTTQAHLTLYFGALNLITDRTQRDVERWRLLHSKGFDALTAEEKAEWQTAMKGAYNYEDMNRVESAVAFVANRLSELGYFVFPEVKATWNVTDHPTKADMDRYFGNIALLRAALPLYQTTPKAPTTSKKMDYLVANDIEKILSDIDRQIATINQSWYYAGDVFTGEI